MKKDNVPVCPCPTCGKENDSASCLQDESADPSPGDFTVCIGCGEILVFTEKLTTRVPTISELMVLPSDCWTKLEGPLENCLRNSENLRTAWKNRGSVEHPAVAL